MKRTSLISAALATGLVLVVPAIAWSQVNPTVTNSPEITDTVMVWHHGGTHRGGHGGHGGCW
ncbi:hypothetical protein [Sphaerothrix gracilis]|uniref:hypothetical protein n=1 Tax=Sphaerothrix gracilis TaxID=3151835 RepID=UPI0031FD173D